MEILDRLHDRLPVVMERVIGAPIERDGATLVPVVSVQAGGGGGEGGGQDGDSSGQGAGGGFGLRARPVGAYVIRDGEVSYQPALDITRIGGQVVAVALVWLVARVVRRRRG